MFVESESYSGVKGEFPEGGAGYLIREMKKKVGAEEVDLWTIPYPADLVSLLECDQRPLPRLYLMCLGEHL